MLRITSAGLFILALVLSNTQLKAGLVLNEFMASNLTTYPDNCDFDDFSDWIELYNPDGAPVSLDNYLLTDNLNKPFKWFFPPGASISAKGYLMIRADGFDAAPGETHVRGFYPWGSTFVTRRYHASFGLSAAGESLGLFRMDALPSEITLISAGSQWKYFDKGTNPGAGWSTLEFDDVLWPQGAGQFGYGEGDEATVVSYGPNSSSKYPTTYFRKRFTVTDPNVLVYIQLSALVDDGAVFYLNGVEVNRLRMAAGSITYQSYAASAVSQENVYETIQLDANTLVSGDNVLAVEVHQSAGNSSDLSFDAKLVVAESTATTMVDSVTFGPQLSDVSYGRDTAAAGGWSSFGIPTPDGPNSTLPLAQPVEAPAVTASLPSGYLSGSQTVNLSKTGSSGTIRYTLDGSIPGAASTVYTGTLSISKTTILRARTFADGYIPGPVLTRTYLIGEPSDRTLPMISIVADPSFLFDPVVGIYTNDTPYAAKGREIPVRMEFFEPNGGSQFAVSTGVKIGGENIWLNAQKPLNAHMRSKYGDDVISHAIFSGEPVGSFGSLNIRNGGDSWQKDMLHDALMAVVLRGQSENDLSSYRPCVMYLNGQYWGIYNIRKQFDSVFFASEHLLEADTYDLVQYANDGMGVLTLMADTGTTETYEAFRTFFNNNDMSDPAIYQAMQAKMNIDSFIDSIVSNDFVMNTSWGHNREFWCGRAAGSKWQWNVPDFDRGFNPGNLTASMIDDFKNGYDLFRVLINNPDFVDRLLQRYAAHLGSTLHPTRISSILNTLSSEVDGEISRHIARWAAEGGIASLASRQSSLNEIVTFSQNRPTYALNQLQSNLGVTRQMVQLTVGLSTAAGGQVQIEGVPMTPAFATSVSMFKNTPFELTAKAAPGFTFTGWSNGQTSATIQLNLSASLSITANFVSGAQTILPASITTAMTLKATASPYSANGDVIVAPGVPLTIEPGVKLLMPPGASLMVNGVLHANGTEQAPIEMRALDDTPWGNLSFSNATGPSDLSYVTVRDTSVNRLDPVNLKAAISALSSTVVMDHMDVEAPLPVDAKYGSTTVRNSLIHSLFTGDGIHVKLGSGLVEDCTLIGNSSVDADGIDYDGVIGGIIRRNRIYSFSGSNSDAIDLGEGCSNLLVTENLIFNIADKGVSVGQGSTVSVDRNLIVDCGIGMGIKDAGSTAQINNNTFVGNTVAVAVYEKNYNHGGGIAYVTNCIISSSIDQAVTVDTKSTLTVSYSLSDTDPLTGVGNLKADPLFTDPATYDFSLRALSPAINTGDPSSPKDTDGTRADIGAYYSHSAADYPWPAPGVVVINEVLAHSHDVAPDWIEIHNNSAEAINLGGWYLSDDPDTLMKFKIAAGTILPANGYLLFYEDLDFGAASTNPGALIPFAISKFSDELSLYGPGDGVQPDYLEKVAFESSDTDVTFGRHYVASEGKDHFVLMAKPTPGEANSAPLTGPIVISSIMYHPTTGAAEYLELTNITSAPVSLYDEISGQPWKMTKGIAYNFPVSPPLVLASGEKILLVRDAVAFGQTFSIPAGTRVLQWDSGSLDNSGESLELSRPGDLDSQEVRHFIRVDRVDYSDSTPWPSGPDSGQSALSRKQENAYGNDADNWIQTTPTPGSTGYQRWLGDQALPTGKDGLQDDPDGDGIRNLMEYALGTSPMTVSKMEWTIQADTTQTKVTVSLAVIRSDLNYTIQKSTDAQFLNWITLQATTALGTNGTVEIHAIDAGTPQRAFYRLSVSMKSN